MFTVDEIIHLWEEDKITTEEAITQKTKREQRTKQPE